MKAAVVVGGAVARRIEYEGHVWAVLQWALGLRNAGWPVLFLDRLDAAPGLRASPQVERREFQVAKNIYVDSRSGWVSDRTACYPAFGRPAPVQDTGLDGDLAAGEGLVTFRTPDEAVDGARRIDAEWPRHARTARSLAMEQFEARRVLPALVDAVAA